MAVYSWAQEGRSKIHLNLASERSSQVQKCQSSDEEPVLFSTGVCVCVLYISICAVKHAWRAGDNFTERILKGSELRLPDLHS